MIGLDCPADVLIQRERERRDRREGMAIAQQARIHSWLLYDLFIDTSTASADDAAQKIVQALSTGRPEAFERTRARLSAA